MTSPAPTRAPNRRYSRKTRLGLFAALVSGIPLLAACASTPAGSASTRGVAWVATDASVTLPGSDITPVDLATRHVRARVPVGSLPSAFAYTAGDSGLLVTAQGVDTLSEINPATHAILHSVTVGVEPDAVAVAPGGTDDKGIALVVNLDSDNVTPVDLGTWRAGKAIPVGSDPVAIAVAVTSTGSATAFVADFGSNQVTPIDVATAQAEPALAVGPGPQTVATGSGQVAVGNFSNSTLTLIGASSLAIEKTVPLPFNPTGMAVTPAGTTFYVCGGSGLVPVTLTGLTVSIGTDVTLPDAAQGIALTADGTDAWVTQQAGTIVPVNLTTGKVGKPIHLGGHPSSIVIGAG